MRYANQIDFKNQVDRDRWGSRDRDRWGGRDRDRWVILLVVVAIMATLGTSLSSTRTNIMRTTSAKAIRTRTQFTAPTAIRTLADRTVSARGIRTLV
jgi:hypothetical protein